MFRRGGGGIHPGNSKYFFLGGGGAGGGIWNIEYWKKIRGFANFKDPPNIKVLPEGDDRKDFQFNFFFLRLFEHEGRRSLMET